MGNEPEETNGHDPLPRELAPGLFWLGACLVNPPFKDGTRLHTYSSMFLLAGEDRSMLVEGGPPKYLRGIADQVDDLIREHDLPPIEYLFTTHAETPHAGGVGVWLERFPDAKFVGDVRDFHLFFPQFEDRFHPTKIGDELDLGGTSFRFVHAELYDLPVTVWGFDTARRALFPGDGFAYAHDHGVGQCGRLAEEVTELPFEKHTAQFTERALYWMIWCDMEPYIKRLEHTLVTELDVNLICPTHGLPTADRELIVPRIMDGLRESSRVTRNAGG